MTRFWWVRHGPTNRKGLYGWTDVPADLSDTAAIGRLHNHLPKDGLVISSDLQRCVATADAISGTRQRLPHSSTLREINFGDWETLTYAEAEAIDADLARDYWSNPGHSAPPGGESWHQAGERISGAVDHLAETYKGRDIIIVAHFAVILTQLQRATGMDPKSAISFSIDNLSVTGIEHLGRGWRVFGVNHKP
ncbi:MAG: histidine phosphatase family protein [Rhodobacteraceae bacterium]|nr:histidine phosphatase family protein [Paracoccaceae bacterium]